MDDAGLLLLRLYNGGLVAAHGSQKLFGAFGGPGLKGTAGFMESLGLQPGRVWGTAAAVSETSGVLTALGLLHPLGSIGTLAAMTMASVKVHGGKPIWGHEGGPELPLTYIAAALTLVLTGPGKYSLDRAFGIRLPRALTITAAVAAAASVAYGLLQPPPGGADDGAGAGAVLSDGETAGSQEVQNPT